MSTPLVEKRDGRICVTGELLMHTAEQIRPMLLASLPTDGSLARLDLSQVTEIDTAGLQLLMAAYRETTSRGTSLLVVAASGAVTEVLHLARQSSLMQPAGGEA